MTHYKIDFEYKGAGTVYVTADSQEEARKKALDFDIRPTIVEDDYSNFYEFDSPDIDFLDEPTEIINEE